MKFGNRVKMSALGMKLGVAPRKATVKDGKVFGTVSTKYPKPGRVCVTVDGISTPKIYNAEYWELAK